MLYTTSEMLTIDIGIIHIVRYLYRIICDDNTYLLEFSDNFVTVK